MKKAVVAVFVLGIALAAWSGAFGADAEKPAESPFKTPAAKEGYALGMEIGTALKGLEVEIDAASFVKGMDDVLKGSPLLLTEEQALEVKRDLFKKVADAREKKSKELAAKNLEEEEKFLAENKKKEGVVTTESGLQYIVLKAGTGPVPTKDDMVKVHYRGTLLNGVEFDSSYKRNEPAVFPVMGVIPGWTEALQLMKVGGKYRVFIPAKLGYGERGAGPKIGPNATLIFDVEPLSIEKAPAMPDELGEPEAEPQENK